MVAQPIAEDARPVVRRDVVQPRSTTAIDAQVGLAVKMRRIELDLSQEKVASRLGITAQQLQKYERGTNRIGASRLVEIARVLDVPIQYFFRDVSALPSDDVDLPASEARSNFSTALEDASTVKLLRMFAACRDPALKNKVISLIEVVIDRG
ncbi:helix-turn-helix domain-containing protein [Acuticoccus sp.]|uniref:helix-turn-helix domain-containing protein n=1 Tax=Acuticoccus sp. TaxID=1904378 RepID=UPI003B527159